MIVLETERMRFRDHETSDLDAFCALEADAEVRRYVGGKPRDREAAEQRFRQRFLGPKPDRLALWATVFKPEGCYIGYCGVYPHFGPEGPIPGEGTLAFYLARAYWGRGLATEAGRAFLDFGFRDLALSRIVATAQTENAASLRVLEKLGFRFTHTSSVGTREFHEFEMRSPILEADSGAAGEREGVITGPL